MKYASAMKYGGELVDAVDCDYESFKELVPSCPNCKETVFLRIGGQRESVKGKAYQIGPHWCHYKGISKEQVAGCELRVNGYTEQDRAKIASQARGQRLKLLQRWFWDVYVNWTPNVSNSCFKEFIEWFRGNTSWKVDGPRYVKYCIDSIVDDKESVAELLKNGLESLKEDCLNAESEYGNNPDYALWMEKATLLKGANFSLHYKITLELIDFLSSSRNRNKLLTDVLIVSYMRLISRVMDRGEVMPSGVSQKLWQEMMQIFIASIFTIPWASEFQRLEAEAKQRRNAA
jgi:hypothetical protein